MCPNRCVCPTVSKRLLLFKYQYGIRGLNCSIVANFVPETFPLIFFMVNKSNYRLLNWTVFTKQQTAEVEVNFSHNSIHYYYSSKKMRKFNYYRKAPELRKHKIKAQPGYYQRINEYLACNLAIILYHLCTMRLLNRILHKLWIDDQRSLFISSILLIFKQNTKCSINFYRFNGPLWCFYLMIYLACGQKISDHGIVSN